MKAAMTADDYWSLPDGVRAELIDGELRDLASPSRKHQEIVAELTTPSKLTSSPTEVPARSIKRPLP